MGLFGWTDSCERGKLKNERAIARAHYRARGDESHENS